MTRQMMMIHRAFLTESNIGRSFIERRKGIGEITDLLTPEIMSHNFLYSCYISEDPRAYQQMR